MAADSRRRLGTMASLIIYHEKGWAACLDADLKKTERPTGDGKLRRVWIVMARNVFAIGENAPINSEVTALVKTPDGKKLQYTARIEGRAKNGNTKLLLTSGGDETKVSETVKKIQSWQDKYCKVACRP